MTDKHLDDLKRALGDAYTIERELTGGGMSRVFVAQEHALGREVVIKVLPPELAAGVNRERFRREVQLAARLSHPYIVPLLHAGEHGELLWFTMPFIPGESLRARLERSGPCTMAETLRFLRNVVEGLSYAHSRGVIHRDIKPANVLSDGQHAVVTDFGVAKALSASMTTGIAGHTTSGMAIGTPAYMAPEQLAADPAADHRVDLYATGLLAYELLMGASPFAAPSPTATMTAQLTRTPEPLHTLRPDVPPAFSQLISRLLAKDPSDRPADAQVVLAELDRVSGAMAADHHRATSDPAVTPRRAASPWPVALSAAAVIALIGGGFYFTLNRGETVTPGRVDTLVVSGGSDNAEGETLPAPVAQRQMTRADSLAIAAALRDELQQIDPGAAQRTPRPAPGVQVVDLEATLARTDSLIRVRLAEITRELPEAAPSATARGTAVGASRGVSGAVVMSTAPGPRRVMVIGTAGRDATPQMTELASAAARDVAHRLRSSGWEVTSMEGIARRDAQDAATRGAEAIITVALAQTTPDSAMLRIQVRNTTPGSAFNFRSISSGNVAKPSSLEPFVKTLDDATAVMADLQKTPRGQVWVQGIGNVREMDRFRFDAREMRVQDSVRRAGRP